MFTKLALQDTAGFDQCFLALGEQLAFQGTDEPRECAQDLWLCLPRRQNNQFMEGSKAHEKIFNVFGH